MQVGSLVRYRNIGELSTDVTWGVVLEENRQEPDRPFFFVRWLDDTSSPSDDAWYHYARLEVICK